MPDLVIDYDLLSQAASQLSSLDDEIETLRSVDTFVSGSSYVLSSLAVDGSGPVLGPGRLGTALAGFCESWAGPMATAGTQVRQLAENLNAVAQNFQAFDTAVARLVDSAPIWLAAIERQTGSGSGPVLAGGDEQRSEGPGDVSGVLGR